MQKLVWRKDPFGSVVENVKTSFPGGLTMREGIVCARLGLIRDERSYFRFSDGRVSIAAFVRMGPGRQFCQDAAMVFMDKDRLSIGVFDGYKPAGTFFSETVPDSIIGMLAQRPGVHGAQVFTEATRQACSLPRPEHEGLRRGGTTAAFATISLDDGCYSLIGVADAAAYRIWPYANDSHGIVQRRLDYSADPRGQALVGMDPGEYISGRHVVGKTISYCDPDGLTISTDGGVLQTGEGILLMSDGITKNLSIGIDPGSGKVADVSGCPDLLRMLRGCSTPEEIIFSVVSEVDHRIQGNVSSGTPVTAPPGELLEPDPDDLSIIVLVV
jgi:hypothetical protein